MRKVWTSILYALLGAAVLAAGAPANEGQQLNVAIITDSRGVPGSVVRKEDLKLGDESVIPHSKLWPVMVANMEAVKASFPTQGRRLQTLSEIPPFLIREKKVWVVLIIQCGYDEYYRPEENRKKLKTRVVAGDIEQRFVEDLTQHNYEIRGSQLEKYTFEMIRKYAKKIVYVTINLGDFEVDRRENERFKKLGVFDYIVELPLDEKWAPTKTLDGAHYNAAGHAYVAEQVIPIVRKIQQELKQAAQSASDP